MSVCAGLRPRVRFLTDLGFGYLDDGSRTHRLEVALLDALLAAVNSSG